MNINLSRIHFPVTTLGPGRRVGIWFQGCSIGCKGCISLDTWAEGKGNTSIDEVITSIAAWIEKSDGITISGGEPFDQPEALVSLILKLRSMTAIDILVYSGYPIEKIVPVLDRIDGMIDVLITDPYIVQSSQTMPLRGSDNQRLHYLTDLGKKRFSKYNRKLDSADKNFDIMFEENGSAWIVGIPLRNDLYKLTEILAADGTLIVISQDKQIEKTRIS
jgi:anaerobic ribonucleoside-triphosphate reductase activating protein